MPKGYWIGHVTVEDPVVYEEYRKANAVAFEKFGARFLVRGGEQTVEEGTVRPRTVVLSLTISKQRAPVMKAPSIARHSKFAPKFPQATWSLSKGMTANDW